MSVNIGPSSDSDLGTILGWLRAEFETSGKGFYPNRSMIERAHSNGGLLVLHEDNEAVAFQLGRLLEPGILEVRRDKRGKGYGRMLVEQCVEEACARDVCVLSICCEPACSIPFWEHMGFKLVSDTLDIRALGGPAFRVLTKAHKLPEGHPEIALTIAFYPENAQHGTGVPALAQHHPRAVCLPDGTIRLAQRIIGFFEGADAGDIVIKVQVNEQTVYFDKAKYREATTLGVRQELSSGAYYIDHLVI